MGRYINLLCKIFVVTTVILVIFGYITKADEQSDLIKGVSTAYCLKGITYSGEITHEGICAGSIKYLGKTIEIYQRLPDNSLGRHLGTFQCMDTGKSKAIKKGTCIDIWMPNKDMCQQWMNKVYADGCKGKIYFKIIEKN